ncbi:triose-phosphate isomerase, partial [Sphingobacteriales bacterium UPWRP_1]
MRNKMVAGNWKMNKTLPEAVQLTTEINQLLQKKKI